MKGAGDGGTPNSAGTSLPNGGRLRPIRIKNGSLISLEIKSTGAVGRSVRIGGEFHEVCTLAERRRTFRSTRDYGIRLALGSTRGDSLQTGELGLGRTRPPAVTCYNNHALSRHRPLKNEQRRSNVRGISLALLVTVAIEGRHERLWDSALLARREVEDLLVPSGSQKSLEFILTPCS